MLAAALAGFLALSLGAVGGLLGHLLTTPRWEEALAATTLSRVRSFYQRPRATVRGLADRLGQWITLPPEALARSLRLTALHQRDLCGMLVADPQGRVTASFDACAPIGREQSLTGSLDPVDERRRLITSTGMEVALYGVEAGRITRIELGAPIHGEKGGLRGYVAATVSLEPLREDLDTLEEKTGVEIRVVDWSGNTIHPPTAAGPKLEPIVTEWGVVIEGSWLNAWLLAAAGALLGAVAGVAGVSYSRRRRHELRSASESEPRIEK
jgi:hypothetical protein